MKMIDMKNRNISIYTKRMNLATLIKQYIKGENMELIRKSISHTTFINYIFYKNKKAEI